MKLEMGKVKCPRCQLPPKRLQVKGPWANCVCPRGHNWKYFGKKEDETTSESV